MNLMNPLDQFELDRQLLKELKDLFAFVPPAELRRTIEDLFFCHLTRDAYDRLPNEKKSYQNLYFLINFLNEVEDQKRQ